ncbi:MAG: hypothetical protein ACJ77K_06760 [Bacteroidia bacterium]
MRKVPSMLIKAVLLSCYFFCINKDAAAQNFGYSFQRDSSSYADLAGPAVLLSNETFINKHPVIHLPFSFNFCGYNTDSVIIETNGFIVFNAYYPLSLISFNAFGGNKDSLQHYIASVNYNSSGTSGNRILKIEFKDLSMNGYNYYDRLSYQVWLYENGNKIEYHVGPNSYSCWEEGLPQLLGPINQNMSTANNAFLISGDPNNPTGELISSEEELSYINNVPAEGTIYTLTPTF